MDRDRDTIWSRRSNNSNNRPSLHSHTSESSFSRHGSSRRSTGNDLPLSTRPSQTNGIAPLNTTSVASPGASSAFGLGSGAFASFGATAKTPKTPSATSDSTNKGITVAQGAGDIEKQTKPATRTVTNSSTNVYNGSKLEHPTQLTPANPLRYTWTIWYRPPASKNVDYEKSIKPLYKMRTVHEFWMIYVHLKRPSSLPVVSDYHFFKEGIRPVWEDEENKRGGKWIIRFKKGVMDRYWDEMLLATVGDQFAEAGEEVCGMVVSVRNGEDVLSVWTKVDGGRNVKIRETIKRVLSLPNDTIINWKSHDSSIAQSEKTGAEKRRNTLNENNGSSSTSKEKPPIT